LVFEVLDNSACGAELSHLPSILSTEGRGDDETSVSSEKDTEFVEESPYFTSKR